MMENVSMNPWSSVKRMPAEVWVLFAATLINRAGTMVLPFLLIYTTAELGFSETYAGLVLVAYGIGALISSPVSGRLADHIGAHWVMRLSLVLTGILLLCLSLTTRYSHVLLVVFTWGFVSEAYRPANLAITSEIVGPTLRKSAIVLNRLSANLGMSIGPAVGGFLASRSFQALFAIDALTSFAAGTVLFLFLKNPIRETKLDPTRTRTRYKMRELLRDRTLLYYLLAILPVVIVFFQCVSTMALYIVEGLKIPKSAYGLLIMLNTVMIIIFELPLNESIAHWPRKRTLTLGAFLISAGLGGLVLASGFWTAALTLAVMTVGEMIFLPASADYVVGIAPDEKKGAYAGLFNMLFSFAFMVAVMFGTQTLERFGPRVLWISVFVLGLISTLMLSRIDHRDAEVAER
jgi:predicted MFS family arabinose efflux permease